MTANVEALLYLYAETPVRPGGEDDLLVDRPIQRDETTGLPIIRGQTLKGALRAHWDTTFGADADKKAKGLGLFGSEVAQVRADDAGGTLLVREAAPVALPLATSVRLFAWVTCTYLVDRLDRLREAAGLPAIGERLRPPSETLWAADDVYEQRHLLGPVVGTATHNDGVKSWAESVAKGAFGNDDEVLNVLKPFKKKFVADVLVGHDDVGGELVRQAPPVITRNKVRSGPVVPFDDEYLPEESLFVASLSIPETDYPVVYHWLHQTVFRLGSDASIGRGLMWARLVSTHPVPPNPEDS